ncbi:KLC4 [Branchiostoma lanceolatum]|uniref:KLC4 protein n=1 Tax=Branchiostoma lanceolatum TaxID=7740 RepID=A0A8K0A2Z9_BRALA|nr:KLC4 [Branchiostoma lanceolatum]
MATGGGKVTDISVTTQDDDESIYGEHIEDGCRALLTRDLDKAEQRFAAALKAVHAKGQHDREAEPLYKLGEVYLKRGIQSKDGGDFTKAAALCNAALVRSRRDDIEEAIQGITQAFVKEVLEIEQKVDIDDTEKHKLMLRADRDYVEKEIKRIELEADPYSLDDDDPKMKEVEMKRAEAIKAFNLCTAWSDLGDHRKAISYYEQSLQMRRLIYGEDTAHPEIAHSLNNLGTAWCDLGNPRKAVSDHEQALQMVQSMYGEGAAHPDIATLLNNLGVDWGDLGDHRKAVSYYAESLQMKRSIYGEDTAHPDIAGSHHNLGDAWSDLGDHRKSISYYEQSIQMMRLIYGGGTAHPVIATSLNNLGVAWSNLGDHNRATMYFKQSLQMRRSVYGEDTAHPDIAGSLMNLALCERG